MTKVTYQQMRLLELVDGAGREERDYLLAPAEQADAEACAALGLLTVNEGVAHLTGSGKLFIISLNT
jgi:hypothetical protein